MDLTILSIQIFDKERKVRVNLSENQWVEFFPFGKDFISNTSELVLKKYTRFIGEVLNKKSFFRNPPHSTKDKKELEELLLGIKIKSILN